MDEIYTFETVIMFKDEMDETLFDSAIDFYVNKLQYLDANNIEIERIGRKKLVYEVKGHTMGLYVMFTYDAPADIVSPLDRTFRLDDNILKFMTTKIGRVEKSEQPDSAAKKPVDVFNLIYGIGDD